MEYPKINTLFKRDENNIIIPSEYTLSEFEYLKYCPFECTEKIDGCLAWNTRIQMADGSVKLIKNVQEGDIILGYDTESNRGVLQIPVLKVTKRSAKGTWVKIKATHQGINLGKLYLTKRIK